MKSPWNHRHFGAILLCSLQKQFTEIHELGHPRWEIRTASKSEQRTAVGCGQLQWKPRRSVVSL